MSKIGRLEVKNIGSQMAALSKRTIQRHITQLICAMHSELKSEEKLWIVIKQDIVFKINIFDIEMPKSNLRSFLRLS